MWALLQTLDLLVFLGQMKTTCSVFLVADCRWEDLAVGAPQFFVKDGSVGGAVYVYINDKGRNWGEADPIQLVGDESSMFGLAVENIGDVNQDGYGGCNIRMNLDLFPFCPCCITDDRTCECPGRSRRRGPVRSFW